MTIAFWESQGFPKCIPEMKAVEPPRRVLLLPQRPLPQKPPSPLKSKGVPQKCLCGRH
jgi:hypothetical protein